MRANITLFASAAGVFGYLTPLDWTNRIPSQEKLSPETEGQTSDRGRGLDVYELAVMFSVAAAIISLCL